MRACVTEYDHSGVLDTVDKICWWTCILMYRLSADQMGGTTSTVDVTTNSTSSVMLSFLHWVIPQYIVLAPTSIISSGDPKPRISLFCCQHPAV